MKSLKQIVLLALIGLTGLCATAQETAYADVMNRKVAALDSLPPTEYVALATEFSRIAAVSGADWHAAYYAAYCRIIPALGDPSEADRLSSEAETMLTLAESLGGDRSEIACLRSMVATARLLVNPQERWQTYGMESSRQLAIAMQANPENPRAYYLQAQSLLYTPAQFGGGKDKALPLAQKAVACYAAATVSPAYAPHWGERQARILLSQCQGE